MASVGNFFQPQVHNNIPHFCHVEEFLISWPLLGKRFPASGTQYSTLLPRGGICGPMVSVGNHFSASGTQHITLFPRGGICGPLVSEGKLFPASCTQYITLLPSGGICGPMASVGETFSSLRYTIYHTVATWRNLWAHGLCWGNFFPASGTQYSTLLPRGGICGPMASVGETFFQPQVHNIAHCCHVEEFVGPWPLLGNLFPASGTQYTTLLPRGGICGPMASVGNPFPASCTQCTKLLPRGGIAGLMTFVINFFSLRYTVTHFCHEEEF
jgi:hypothetical protein